MAVLKQKRLTMADLSWRECEHRVPSESDATG